MKIEDFIVEQQSAEQLEELIERKAANGAFPWIGDPVKQPFPDCGPEPLGIYAIVEEVSELERMVEAGIRTIQLRMKYRQDVHREKEIEHAVAIVKNVEGTRLFINDDWEHALKAGAYGVHLGQDDMEGMSDDDLNRLQDSGVRLGLSTHSFQEMARAWAWRPSYLAIGTVFETSSKEMDYKPLGVPKLARMSALAPTRIVAIGGINLERAPDVMTAWVDGIAAISALADSPDLAADILKWRTLFR